MKPIIYQSGEGKDPVKERKEIYDENNPRESRESVNNEHNRQKRNTNQGRIGTMLKQNGKKMIPLRTKICRVEKNSNQMLLKTNPSKTKGLHNLKVKNRQDLEINLVN